MSLTTCSPIWIAISSDDAQYLPSRNSRTKTGTLAPTLTLRTRSLRTTLPAKTPVDLVVERVAERDLLFGDAHIPSLTGISPDWPSTASVAGS